jgi:hypothetical protein
VALVHRRPRTDAVDVGDEREREAGQVITAPGDGELEVLALEAGLGEQIVGTA